MRKINIYGIAYKDYTTWMLNLTLTLTRYFYITASRQKQRRVAEEN